MVYRAHRSNKQQTRASLLNNTFDDDQDNSLADYIELSLQLQFNERSRNAD